MYRPNYSIMYNKTKGLVSSRSKIFITLPMVIWSCLVFPCWPAITSMWGLTARSCTFVVYVISAPLCARCAAGNLYVHRSVPGVAQGIGIRAPRCARCATGNWYLEDDEGRHYRHFRIYFILLNFHSSLSQVRLYDYSSLLHIRLTFGCLHCLFAELTSAYQRVMDILTLLSRYIRMSWFRRYRRYQIVRCFPNFS